MKQIRDWLQQPEELDESILKNRMLRGLFHVTSFFQRHFILMLGIALGLFLVVMGLALTGGRP